MSRCQQLLLIIGIPDCWARRASVSTCAANPKCSNPKRSNYYEKALQQKRSQLSICSLAPEIPDRLLLCFSLLTLFGVICADILGQPSFKLEMKPLLLILLVVFSTLIQQYKCEGPAVEWMSCDEHLNDYDRAKIFFTFAENTPADFSIFAVNDDCYKCSWTFIGNSTSGCTKIWTPFAWTLHLARYNESLSYPDNHYQTLTSLFSSKYTFGDQGIYTFNINGETTGDGMNMGSFSIVENNSPTDVYEPLYIFIAMSLAIAFITFTYEPILKMIKEKGIVEDIRTDQKSDGTYSAISASGRQHDYVSVPLLEEGINGF